MNPLAETNHQFDITIVGGGMVGLSLEARLQAYIVRLDHNHI